METIVAILSAAKLLGLDATRILEAVVIFFLVFFMTSFVFGFLLYKLSKPILKVVIEFKAELVKMTESITGLTKSLHEHVKLTNTSFEDGKTEFNKIHDELKAIKSHIGI